MLLQKFCCAAAVVVIGKLRVVHAEEHGVVLPEFGVILPVVDMEAERGVLVDIAQMRPLLGQSHVRVEVPLDVVSRTDVIATPGADLVVEHLPCMFIAALEIGIDIVMSLAVEIFTVPLLHQ